MRRSPRLLALGLLALVTLGCSNNFFAQSLVRSTRIVGARLHVAGDDTRAWPLPGESVSLDYYVLRADEAEVLSAGLFGCAVASNRSGAPTCGGAPFASFPPRAPDVMPIHFEMTIPDEAALGGATSVLLALASCAGGGMPSVAPGASFVTCDGEMPGHPDLTSLTFQIATTVETANHHPELDDETYTIDGAPWDVPPDVVPAEGCSSEPDAARLPKIMIPASGAHVVRITFTSSEDDRESYAARDGMGAPVTRREVAQYSHYLTAGALQRQFSTIDDATTPPGEARIDWTAPASSTVPAGGLTVRFWWVTRDLRGGFDILERVACVEVIAP